MSKTTANILGAVGKFLIITGVLILLFAGFQLWGTGLAEARAQDSLESEFEDRLAAIASVEPQEADIKNDDTDNPVMDLPESTQEAPEPVALDPENIPQSGEAVGTLEIPAINVKKTFVEGVTRDVLREGPGHYPSTPLPGQAGNSAIAGHRTTHGAPFFDIDKVKPGDEIFVTTLQGRFRYVIEEHIDEAGASSGYQIVTPDKVEVLADTGDNRLTLTACHPKYSARLRIVVTAKLASPEAPPSELPSEVAMKDIESAAVVDADESLTESLDWQPQEARPTLIWGVLTLGLASIAVIIGRAWKRWPVYLAASPLVITSLFYCFTHLDKWIPAV